MRTNRHRNPQNPPATRFLPPQPTIPAFIDTALVKPRAGLRGTAAVRQLADDFREASYREGGADRDHLRTKGWTNSQLDEHGPAANELAQQLTGAAL